MKIYVSKKDFFKETDGKTYYDINNVDIVIAGSDQIWNPSLTGGVSDIYTLNLNTQANKIIYGASVGNEDVLDIHKEEFKVLEKNENN